jgi:hypothetical protein
LTLQDQSGAPAITTIDGVVAHLNDIILQCSDERSRLGFFAALYRNVTKQVKAGIATGSFEDGPRMERLDVAFAKRYFDALDGYTLRRTVSRCWAVSFQAAAEWQPLILQQLLLGMNAHINLDLGIAAAEVAPGDQLAALQHDFEALNDILAAMIAKVRSDIEKVSPWIRLLDRFGSPAEGIFINFALDKARANAWSVATRLVSLSEAQRAVEVDVLDSWVAILGNLIRHPVSFILNTGIAIVRSRESNNVKRVITELSQA